MNNLPHWVLTTTAQRAVSLPVRVRLSDRKASAELMSRLDIECVTRWLLKARRLRWFGHVERKQPDDWVSACRHIAVQSVKGWGRGRPRKTWRECVEENMSKLKLSVEDTQDRAVWRNGILGNRLTHAVARKNDVKRWWWRWWCAVICRCGLY